jgi:hypothetical protein
MGEDRYAALARKRGTEGLTDEEADELGRLMAEREDRSYSNADDLRADQAQEKVDVLRQIEDQKQRQEEEAHADPAEVARERRVAEIPEE